MCCCPSKCCCLCFLLILIVAVIGFIFGFGVFSHGFQKIKDTIHAEENFSSYSSPSYGNRPFFALASAFAFIESELFSTYSKVGKEGRDSVEEEWKNRLPFSDDVGRGDSVVLPGDWRWWRDRKWRRWWRDRMLDVVRLVKEQIWQHVIDDKPTYSKTDFVLLC